VRHYLDYPKALGYKCSESQPCVKYDDRSIIRATGIRDLEMVGGRLILLDYL